MDKWIKDSDICDCYSDNIKEENSAICSKMDEPGEHCAQWNMPDRKANTVQYHLHVDSLKTNKQNDFVETENTCWMPPGVRGVVSRVMGTKGTDFQFKKIKF